MTTRTRTDAVLIAGFCAFLFFYGLGQFGLVGADEPRYAQVAREMFERHDWITPVLSGQPWLEKPPLYYWQTMLAYSLFGVSDWSARVASAFDATCLVLVVYLFFRRFRRGIEVDAALITASCAGIIGYARAASMDMALAATFTIAMLCWWAWRESGTRAYLAGFYVLLALGTLAKGPVALILAVAIIALYSLLTREFRVVLGTIWFPGVLLFCILALPWYFAVQMRNPEFFRIFILEHNLERFGKDVFHHPAPFWYYLPVTLLAIVPWTVWVVVAFVDSMRAWWVEWRRETTEKRAVPVPVGDLELQFSVFASGWVIVPVVFFSISQSKLPGYILPAVPAGALLLADYLRQRLGQAGAEPAPKWLAVLHALISAAPFVPALLISRLLNEHRLPQGKPLLFALGLGFLVCAGVALTLVSKPGLRMLRFVTLIPVILTVAAVLKVGSADIDQILSARPLAQQLASLETRPLPVAVCGVPRELEYGLTFYRNRLTLHYEPGKIPSEEHLLVGPENSREAVARLSANRRVSFLGHYAPQHVDYFWVSAQPGAGR